MSIFTALQNKTHDIVSATMGTDAVWHPTNGEEVQSARVLFNDPSLKKRLEGVDYMPSGWSMEYRAPFFAKLFDSVRHGGEEIVEIEGNRFFVREVTKEYDGITYIAKLEQLFDE